MSERRHAVTYNEEKEGNLGQDTSCLTVETTVARATGDCETRSISVKKTKYEQNEMSNVCVWSAPVKECDRA